MNRPNFFLVGAPKCGTSSMHEFLSQQPQAFMSTPKELHYFAPEFPARQVTPDRASYLAAFRQADAGAKVIGESSTGYLVAEGALERIHAFEPAARVLAMVRNPVDLVVSLHAQRQYEMEEDQPLEAALALESRRARGECVPRYCRTPELLQYRKQATLGKQISRLLSIFDPRQVHIVVYDDLLDSTATEARKVCEFLDIDVPDSIAFPLVNERKQVRFASVARWTKAPPRRMVAASRQLKRAVGIERLGLLQGVRRLNSRRVRRSTIRSETRASLASYFADDVQLLSRLLARDLSHWSKAG